METSSDPFKEHIPQKITAEIQKLIRDANVFPLPRGQFQVSCRLSENVSNSCLKEETFFGARGNLR